MDLNHTLRLIADFLQEQNLHRTVATLVDEAALPCQQESSKLDQLIDAEDWPGLVNACQKSSWRDSQALF